MVSPNDETFEKFAFYAARGVDEIIVANPADHTVSFFAVADGAVRSVEHSELLNVSALSISTAIDWPT